MYSWSSVTRSRPCTCPGSVVIPQHVHDEAEFNVHFRSLKEEHMAYPPPYPPPVIDDTPQIAINETADEPPAGGTCLKG